LLLLELIVQIPFVGFNPLQAVLGAVAVALLGLGGLSSRGRTPSRRNSVDEIRTATTARSESHAHER
jgi:hypothetical protein